MVMITCSKCGRDLTNGLCIGCLNPPQDCTCVKGEKIKTNLGI